MISRRRTLDAFRRAFPSAYEWTRARSAPSRALVAWYADRLGRGAPDAYGDEFWDFHSGGDWDALARVLLRFTPASSVLDVGCGDAKLLGAMLGATDGLRALGIDSSAVALRAAEARGVDTLTVDLASLGRREVERVARRIGPFDLAVSLETVEHFPSWHSGKLLRLVTCAPVVVFSAAQPRQGGTLHVNERPIPYWIERFARLGYDLSLKNEAFRSEIAALDLPPWYGANVNLFVRRA